MATRVFPFAALLIALGCDANLTPSATDDGSGVTFTCLPNLDGRIDAAELPVALDVAAEYFVSPDTAVDLAGVVGADGRREWDLGDETPQDIRVLLAATALGSQWYAESFGGGQFVIATEVGGDVDAIYRRDDQALWLLGLASREPDPPGGRVLLVYDQAAALIRFPVEVGQSYTSTGVIDQGRLDGLPYNGTDLYEISVGEAGRVVLPYVSFEQTFRIDTHVTVTPAVGGVTTSRRQVSFLFECFGEVARATSRAGETASDFTTGAELRRFAL